MRIFVLVFFLAVQVSGMKAQQIVRSYRYLYKPLSIEAKGERLEDVLDRLSKKGGFYFAYSSSLIQKDSLVNLSVENTPVKDILDKLLTGRYEYRESSNYIIIRPAFYRLAIDAENIASSGKRYSISGFVTDDRTGQAIPDVSVYEKRLLKASLTDNKGHFSLKFKGSYQSVLLTASRENYKDTTVMFLSSISISPKGYPDTSFAYGGSGLVERLGFGKFMLSSKQRIQNLNISGFLANAPFQASLTPGLSSHGMLSPQVVNKGSLNLVGGYTAGVNGVEVAGVFNINKKDVKYIQVGGFSNMVGGSVEGVQVGGAMNTVLKNVSGVQVGGAMNAVRDSAEGAQVAGALNMANSLNGAQIAGALNYTGHGSRGVQIAGALNISNKDLNGVQIAGALNFGRKGVHGVQIGLFNYAKKLDGLQIGVLNVSDTSSGVSIGLFNWVTKGYHKASLSGSDVLDANFSFKSGNAKLYTMLHAGMNLAGQSKAYAAGLGFGHDVILNKRLIISAETSAKYVYLGNIDDFNMLSRLEANLQLRLRKGLSLFSGPAYNVYYSTAAAPVAAPGYKATLVPSAHQGHGRHTKGWPGWSAGLILF